MATYEGIIDFRIRISEAGDIRISEAGDVRIAEQYYPESLTVDDAVLVFLITECILSESIAVNDSVSCQVIFQGACAESSLVNDNVLTSLVAECILSESGLSDDSVLPQWVAECILAESSLVSSVADALRTIISESIAVSDSVLVEVDISISESVNVSDATSVLSVSIYAWLTIEGNETFAIGDILRIKDGNDDEWLEVSNIAYAPQYGVIRDKGGNYAADLNPAWTKGAAVVNYGQSGDGGVYMTASETNAPYLSVFTHAGSPWSALTTRLRIGNLNGFLGYASDLYGIAIGETEKYLKYDPTNGLRIKGDITVTGGSGIGSFSDAGTLVTGDSLDDVPNGATYGRVALTSISAGKIVVAGLDAGVTGRIFADSTTKTNIEAWRHASDVTTIDGGDIYTGSVTAAKITVTSLSALNANLGTITAGLAKSSDDKLQVDFDNKWIKVWDAQETPVLRVHLGYIP
uniref:Uncharacterized protein n=1 Tax=Candidatus Desulfatibia profunda TaxID=2841695 RepID=A0A8J6NVT5_9BACT|nr:hypothetical protein [Candidatus Desulfatibia profunda]